MKRLCLLVVLLAMLAAPALAVIPGYIPDGDFQPTFTNTGSWQGINLAKTDGVVCNTLSECKFRFAASDAHRVLYKAVETEIPPGIFTLSAVVSRDANVADNAYIQLNLMRDEQIETWVYLAVPGGVLNNTPISVSFLGPYTDAFTVYLVVNSNSAPIYFDDVSLIGSR